MCTVIYKVLSPFDLDFKVFFFDGQAFTQMGGAGKASCGCPLSKENCFISHMLPYTLLI